MSSKRLANSVTSYAIPGLTRPVSNRAVHLRLHPRPESLGESREILRLLHQHGNVEMFRSLKYDTASAPNTMIAIFEREEAAKSLMRLSPVRFELTDQDSNVEKTASRFRQYELSISAANFHHRDHINDGVFHGPYRLDTGSISQYVLVKRVPLEGLSDLNFRRPDKPWRVLSREAAYEKKQHKTLRQLWREKAQTSGAGKEGDQVENTLQNQSARCMPT